MAFEGEDARRWAVTDAPTLQPAVDFITKSPNGPFIDTGLNVTFEMRGRVYLSVETIKEMAEIAGLLDVKNAQEKALYDIEIYNKGYKDGLKEGADLSGKLSDISRHLADVGSSLDVADISVVEASIVDAGKESGKSDGDSDDLQVITARSRKSGGKTRAASSGGRPNDVSSLSDDNDTFRI